MRSYCCAVVEIEKHAREIKQMLTPESRLAKSIAEKCLENMMNIYRRRFWRGSMDYGFLTLSVWLSGCRCIYIKGRRMRKSWTIKEDCKLLTLVRQHFSALVSHNRLNATMPFSQQLHDAFDSPDRDAAALLYRLEQAKILDLPAVLEAIPLNSCFAV